MKKLKRYKLIVLGLFIGIVSCTNGFEELNKDPNRFNEAQPENVFAGAVKNTLSLVGGIMNDQMYLSYASYLGGKGGQFPHFFYQEGALNGYWGRFNVGVLKNVQEIIDNYSDNPQYANRVHIAKIWKSYVYSIMVATFGPVPMGEAMSEDATPAYDSEEEIYSSILSMLKEAAEGIDPEADQLLQDPVFNGDNNLWIKFANTLRLKIALRISTGFPELAGEHGRETMANEEGLISSNTENAVMRWGTEQENWSFNYDRYVFGDPNPEAIQYINFHFLLNLKTYKDPRVGAFADPSPNPIVIQDTLWVSDSETEPVVVRYPIPYIGRALAGLAPQPLAAWNLDPNRNILNGVAVNRYSTPDKERFWAMDSKFNIVTYAETNLMKAEAQLKGWGGNKSAEEYYYAGIDASFEQWGVPGAAEYKGRDGIKWGTESRGDKDIFGVVSSGITADPLDKIIRQRWIAMYYQGFDAWCMQKRTRLLPIIPHFQPVGAVAGSYTYAEIPERMIYPPTEKGVNPEAYAAAVAALGGDRLESPLKMNRPSDPIDWEALPAEYNQEFASKWYGDSVDDLIAAGIEYEIVD